MTTPPEVPPLTAEQHARLRSEVMNRTTPSRRTTGSRWVPVMAVAAVAAVAIGAVSLGRPSDLQPPVTSTTAEPKQLTPPEFTSLTDVDLGPVPNLEETAAEPCVMGKPPAEVFWGRQVRGVTPGSRITVLLIRRAGQGEGPFSRNIAVCIRGQLNQPLRDRAWDRRPTTAQGLSILTGGEFGTPVGAHQQSFRIYRAIPEIARVEARYVWQGGAGEWTKGVVSDGFAYTDTRVQWTGQGPTGLKEEVRAFDAAGNAVPVKPS